MAQMDVLDKATQILVDTYTTEVGKFSLTGFLKAGVDPFRFGCMAALFGEREAVRREVEHKLAMKLENMMGDFHEAYLGNALHIPTDSRWELVQRGEIPGVDIMNRRLNAYIQIKSKHNSMNSSSSKRLADELKNLLLQDGTRVVACGWVIASQKQASIGESEIAKVARVLKGPALYKYITGNENEMDEVVKAFPSIIQEKLTLVNAADLIHKAAEGIYRNLEAEAKASGDSIMTLLYKKAICSPSE